MSKLYCVSKYLILINFVILFSDCNSRESQSNKDKSDNISYADSVVKDIPEFFQSSRWRNYFSNEQKILSIKPIDNGYRDLQIRIWIGHGYLPKYSSQLIMIKKTGKIITGELYTYIPHQETNTDSVLPANKRVDTLIPRSGWDNFIDSIQKLGIYELPDYKKLPGYYLSNDSFGATFEIATPTKYRIYDYPDYEEFKDKIAEAGKAFKIMSLIEDEFNTKVMY
ncbi:MAG: hypothetical protein Q8941_22405 [Bacteroidota bacterium]|nr:hypothetical protein [Bacteroidota bacterium]